MSAPGKALGNQDHAQDSDQLRRQLTPRSQLTQLQGEREAYDARMARLRAEAAGDAQLRAEEEAGAGAAARARADHEARREAEAVAASEQLAREIAAKEVEDMQEWLHHINTSLLSRDSPTECPGVRSNVHLHCCFLPLAPRPGALYGTIVAVGVRCAGGGRTRSR